MLLYLTESGAFYAAIQVSANVLPGNELCQRWLNSPSQIVRLALSLSVVPSTPVYGSLHTASNIFTYATAIITVSIMSNDLCCFASPELQFILWS